MLQILTRQHFLSVVPRLLTPAGRPPPPLFAGRPLALIIGGQTQGIVVAVGRLSAVGAPLLVAGLGEDFGVPRGNSIEDPREGG